MVVGPTGGGKSVVINTLCQAQTRYRALLVQRVLLLYMCIFMHVHLYVHMYVYTVGEGWWWWTGLERIRVEWVEHGMEEGGGVPWILHVLTELQVHVHVHKIDDSCSISCTSTCTSRYICM